MVPVSDAMTPAPAASVRVETLRIRRGFSVVLSDFSWVHNAGVPAWLVGENGAGKSSLLRVLAGRARPAAGAVYRIAPEGRARAPLYFHPAIRLPRDTTLRDWLRLMEAFLEGAPPLPEPLAPELRPDRRLDTLSTGEAKRLLLAALLQIDSPFVFLDEPYEHLSEEARASLTAALVRRARHDVVVIATNQPIPPEAMGPVVRLDERNAIVHAHAEVVR